MKTSLLAIALAVATMPLTFAQAPPATPPASTSTATSATTTKTKKAVKKAVSVRDAPARATRHILPDGLGGATPRPDSGGPVLSRRPNLHRRRRFR